MDDATTEEQQQALSAALRRQQAFGLIGQLSGDSVLSGVGKSLLSSADSGEQRMDAAKNRRLQLKLEGRKDQELQQYRQDQLAQHQDDMAQRSQDRGLQLRALADQRGARAEAAQAAAADRKANADERLDLRRSGLLSQLSSKMMSSLDEGSFTGPIKSQVEAKQRGTHLLALAKKAQGGGFNNLTDAEQEELALGFGQLVSGGKPTAGEVAGLIPPETLQSGAQGIKQWFKNEPLGRNQMAFTERTAHSVERQMAVAQGLIDKEKAQRAASQQEFKKLSPEQWATNIIQAGLDPNRFDAKGIYQVPDPTPEGGMVNVVSPEGAAGQIPADKLEAALKRGFKRAP